MALVYITRKIPDIGINLLRAAGHEVDVSEKDGVLTRAELISALSSKPYDAVLSLLTDTIDEGVFDSVPSAKIFANYAVGYNNLSLPAAKERGITITNTPGVLTNTVAEFAVALIFDITKRIAESDRFTRAGNFKGWAPELLLGADLAGKTLGLLGAGRIGYEVALKMSRGMGMKVIYYDIARNEALEREIGAEWRDTVEALLPDSDIVSIHVPLLPTTTHLMNAERLALMKPSAYLINTSRGPVVDEAALVEALRNKVIRGAALDVFEKEPELMKGLNELDNVVITPHIASATEETRNKMSEMAAQNIIDFLAGETPQNVVPLP